MNRRRSYEDLLAKIRHPTWLVVENMFGCPLEVTPLEPYADWRAMAARATRVADGWLCDEIGRALQRIFLHQRRHTAVGGDQATGAEKINTKSVMG
jgi:hypothetical protein